MADCRYEGFWCRTHECGQDVTGAMRPCLKPECPHCGASKPRVNTALLLKRLTLAQRRLEGWEKKNARAAAEVVKNRAEVRRLWAKLEKAGEHVDPMQLLGEREEEV